MFPDWGKESIGQRATRICKESGFTQVELAGKINIGQTLVTDYETDKPSREVLRQLAKIETFLDAAASKTVHRA